MNFVRKNFFSPHGKYTVKAKPGTNSLGSSTIKMTFQFLFIQKAQTEAYKNAFFCVLVTGK